ncbi:MAG: hypothetical protein WBC33_12305 [Conexibacter sp.]
MWATSPFRYEEPLAPDELIDREQELSALLERAAAGRNSRLTGPRRFGKTTLLRRVLRDADRQGLIPVYVDLYGVLTIADVSARLELAYEQQLDGALRRWFTVLRRSLRPVGRVSAGPAAVELSGAPRAVGPDAGARALLERLATPAKLHEKTGRVVLVAFDEFQALLGAGAQLDGTFRSEIQHHGDGVSYVFAGSHPGMMRELFSNRRRPFFDQAAAVQLPPLPDAALAERIGTTFAASDRECADVLDLLLDLAAGHPQRAMQLASHLWSHTARGAAADAETWERTLASVGAEVEDELRARWDALSGSQRRVLSAIAVDDAPLYSAETGARHGTTKGATGPAVRPLVDSGEIEPDAEATTGYRVVDPLVRLWVVNGRAWPR